MNRGVHQHHAPAPQVSSGPRKRHRARRKIGTIQGDNDCLRHRSFPSLARRAWRSAPHSVLPATWVVGPIGVVIAELSAPPLRWLVIAGRVSSETPSTLSCTSMFPRVAFEYGQ